MPDVDSTQVQPMVVSADALSRDPSYSNLSFVSEGIKNYYSIRIETDPNSSNIAAYADPSTAPAAGTVRHAPPLRCASPAAQNVQLSKILGVAFTYETADKKAVDISTVGIEHDSAMYTYVGDKRIDRIIDWWTVDQSLDTITPSRFHDVPIRYIGDVQGLCITKSGVDNWNAPQCYQSVLGTNTVAGSTASPEAGVLNVNFLNAYLGGTWNLYIPAPNSDTPTGLWNTFHQDLKGLKMHIFYARTGNLN